MLLLGYVGCGHIPDDVQIGHRGKERELLGIQKGKYYRKYDKDSQNLVPDRDEKAAVVLTVVLVGNRALEGVSGTKLAKFSCGTTVQICGSHQVTKRTGQFTKRA